MKLLLVLCTLAASVLLISASGHYRSQVGKSCKHAGKTYGVGRIPFSPKLPCRHCRCVSAGGDLVRKTCSVGWCGGRRRRCRKPWFKLVKQYGKCCPTCVRVKTSVKGLCLQNGKTYKHGSKIPNPDPCKSCRCNYGRARCSMPMCGLPRCLFGVAPVKKKGVCCPVCPPNPKLPPGTHHHRKIKDKDIPDEIDEYEVDY